MSPLRSLGPQVTFHQCPRLLTCYDLEKKSSPSFSLETKSQYSLLTALTYFLKIPKMSQDLFIGCHGLRHYRIGLGSHSLGLAYLFGQFHYHLGNKLLKYNLGPNNHFFSVNNCAAPPPPGLHLIGPMGHVCMY